MHKHSCTYTLLQNMAYKPCTKMAVRCINIHPASNGHKTEGYTDPFVLSEHTPCTLLLCASAGPFEAVL